MCIMSSWTEKADKRTGFLYNFYNSVVFTVIKKATFFLLLSFLFLPIFLFLLFNNTENQTTEQLFKEVRNQQRLR